MKPVNRILAFDVSNNNCSVAISAGQEILAYEEDLRPSMQAEILILLIERALQSINYDYQDIDYLALTNGPGSFTGIRIGLATAEGILISTNIQGLAISNFEMSYYRLQRQVKYFDKAVILLNAYRNQLYYQEFDPESNKGKYGLIDIDKVSNLFRDKKKKIVCTGSGMSEIYDQIEKNTNITILPRFARINATQVCKYADEKINNGEVNQGIGQLYIRPPDAKIPTKRTIF
ncbi:tRNA (adenosine(37)-N6)-threonylcarbamoyltransferase complex dimerization subunit type 1 TsaB [Candidatus Megaera polyxenophila]|uniref:tRNA (adenosine(37)-N6)-threonylcarbamoyltransferase complex dimerization subunit type 1 TsaB n=1 Tax=Candidatus Megaera polyxenophila TaxID=988779 RepID=UPI00249DF037|nr:tRNA (adenosine(37)-N6)-threonylcarbamoyltransferase complex dimerization subunit type 1 TsaB [Candidatus Megaera polyxenophila]